MIDSQITIVGNATRDPEVAFGQSGKARARFAIAVNRKPKDGEETVTFYEVVCFGTLAENVGESIQKGNRVHVTGRLEYRTYEKKDGTQGTSLGVVADEVSPSLLWASAVIYKNEKNTGGAPAASAPGPRPRGAAPAPADSGYGYDEEPF